MKAVLRAIGALLLTFTLSACGQEKGAGGSVGEAPISFNAAESFDPSEMETDTHVLSPLQEEEYSTRFQGMAKPDFKFGQSIWAECTDTVTGNYTGVKCSNSRGISTMLKTFMQTHMHQCVNQGLAAQGIAPTEDFHVIHAGILGDRNHSPRSLHAENRAIDIKSIKVQMSNGTVREMVYASLANRAFYTAFRKCWGEVVHVENGCPYASGVVGHTGSIGWENADHQHHLHTSVPYCVAGQYGPNYYQR